MLLRIIFNAIIRVLIFSAKLVSFEWEIFLVNEFHIYYEEIKAMKQPFWPPIRAREIRNSETLFIIFMF